MEGLSATVYKRLKTYINRTRGYQRLNHRKPSRAELGPDPNPNPGQRRSWRVKIARRIKILGKMASPKGWLTRLRDAYVEMMLCFASSGVPGPGLGGPGKPALKEYDDRVLVEIYKSLMIARGHITPRHARNNDKLGSHPRRLVVSAVLRN